MRSFLNKDTGIYEPGKRFAFTNITSEPFTSKWNGMPIVVNAGETIELSDLTPIPGSGMGECLAVKMTGELVDNLFFGKAKADENSKGKDYYRSPIGSSMAVPGARKPYEDQILQELPTDEAKTKVLAQQKMSEIMTDSERKEGVSYESGGIEFADITKPESSKIEKSPVKTTKAKKA